MQWSPQVLVLRLVPYQLTTAITVGVLFVADRKMLKEIDYMLLLTFVCFFTISENLGRVDEIRMVLQQLLQSSTLLTAVCTSQVISNVPAAVVLSGFTDQWQQMLAGVNIGGLGTPVASLASLITIKFYMRWPDAKLSQFLRFFTLANVFALAALSWPSATEEGDVQVALPMVVGSVTQSGVPFPDL